MTRAATGANFYLGRRSVHVADPHKCDDPLARIIGTARSPIVTILTLRIAELDRSPSQYPFDGSGRRCGPAVFLRFSVGGRRRQRHDRGPVGVEEALGPGDPHREDSALFKGRGPPGEPVIDPDRLFDRSGGTSAAFDCID